MLEDCRNFFFLFIETEVSKYSHNLVKLLQFMEEGGKRFNFYFNFSKNISKTINKIYFYNKKNRITKKTKKNI
jgi:hypothetical protein